MNKGIYMNTEYLEKFFRNLLLGESNELKNRYCHIKYNEKVAIKSQKSSDKTATKEKSSDIILNYLKENDLINNSTAREITGLTAPAVRKIFKKLEAEGLIVGTGENKNRTYSLKRQRSQSIVETIFLTFYGRQKKETFNRNRHAE